MGWSIGITPGGHLQLVESADDPALEAESLAELRFALDRSRGDGLVRLAGAIDASELPPSIAYWKNFARRGVQAVCRLGEAAVEHWRSAAPPSDEALDEFAAEAPPMRGGERLDREFLRACWEDLLEALVSQAKSRPGGAGPFLHELDPLFRLVGRVTFHLAENKRDPQHPFAFLATYAHRVSRQAKVQHVPLGQALKDYAERKEQHVLMAMLEPVRVAAERSELVAELWREKRVFAPQAWSIREAHRFLVEVPLMEECGLVVRVPDWWSARKPPRPQVQVRLGTKADDALGFDRLMDFDVEIALEGEPLTAAETRQVLAAAEGLLLLRGRWVEVDRERLNQALEHWSELQSMHPDGLGFVEGMRLLANAGTDDGVADEARAEWSHVTAGTWLRETLERLRDPNSVKGCQPGRDLHATLRPYQAEGVRWLWFLGELGLGACLADDMGLGKTIQVIDLLLQRRRLADGGPLAPSLLIVPASLLGNWRAELERFGPSLRFRFAHRSEADAEQLTRLSQKPQRELDGCDLLITTYALVRRQTWLAGVRWSLVILDEAQAIKNAGSAQSRAVKKLPAQSRLVLTGTPVENHLGDLWSLFDFCCPGLLGTAPEFQRFIKALGKSTGGHGFAPLRQLVRPYILRRLKTDPNIVPDLPDKIEMRVDCGLVGVQAALYESVVKDLALRLRDAEGIARRGLVLATLVKLKQLCNHPALFQGQGAFDPQRSGKFQRLESLCETIFERQEKALVFTQFQSLTEPLAQFLAQLFGRPGLVLDGTTPVARRGQRVKAFQDPDGPPFFVISLKAGGTGLNLTAASHVVHFDRWWNPAVENQATDRAFRIGQKRNVVVHKFVCRGTVEEKIDAMIRDKQAISRELLDENSEGSLTEMNDEQLLNFVALDLRQASAE